MVPLKQVLEFNPIPETATDEEKKRVIGVQCNLWSEFIPDMGKLAYQAFPRWLAMAEVGWSSEEKKSYTEFKSRAIPNMKFLQAKHGIKPGPVQE
jgi:hexosaminidase